MNTKFNRLGAALLLAMAPCAVCPAQAADLLVQRPQLTMDTALHIAQGAVDACRTKGIAVGVTVVDLDGIPQVVLRDTLAPRLTLRISREKAYTAVSFNQPTAQLEGRFPGAYSVPKSPGLLISAGAVPIRAGGQLLGAVGVSGSATGEQDAACAQAGVDAVQADLDLQGQP